VVNSELVIAGVEFMTIPIFSPARFDAECVVVADAHKDKLLPVLIRSEFNDIPYPFPNLLWNLWVFCFVLFFVSFADFYMDSC